jgi:carboxypeptidase C (cathepsin A)
MDAHSVYRSTLLKIDDEGYPVQPYGIKENPYSILDVADIVFVNPVNTGYSRAISKDTPKQRFFWLTLM